MVGELNYTEIEEILQDQVIGRIGYHLNGVTYIIPVGYAYIEPYAYMHSIEGKKVAIMRKNPEVCFEVDIIFDIANWRSVIAWGTFEELPAGDERNKAIKILSDRSLPIIVEETTDLADKLPFPYNNESDIEGIFYRINLKQKTGRYKNSYPVTSIKESTLST